MKITSALAAAAAVAAAGSVGIIGAPIASADDPTITTLGSQAKLVDGNVVQGLDHQQPQDQHGRHPPRRRRHAVGGDRHRSGHRRRGHSDRVEPQRAGQEWADLPGAVRRRNAAGRQPIHARAGREDHRQGVLRRHGRHPGQRRLQRRWPGLLVWVQPPPQPRQSGGSSSGARGQTSPAAPAAATTPGTPAPAGSPAAATGTEGAPLPAGAPLPSGSAGTPLPAGTPGTPVPASTPGTPVPAGSQGTPLPAGTPGAPVAANSEGAPLPASVQEAPAVAPAPVSQGTPLPAGSEGTPVAPTTTTVAPQPPA